MNAPTLMPRSRVVRSTTYRAPTLLGTAYITVSEDDGGAPLEAFVNVGKAGSDTFAVAEAMGRLVSLILRMPSSLSRRERAGQIVAQLTRVGCYPAAGARAARCISQRAGAASAPDRRGRADRCAGSGKLAPRARSPRTSHRAVCAIQSGAESSCAETCGPRRETGIP